FAIWKSGKGFDAQHYPWSTPSHVEQDPGAAAEESTGAGDPRDTDLPRSVNQAAGHKPVVPAKQVVTAARQQPADESDLADERTFIDFAHLKQQLTMAQVLDHLGLLSRLRGHGAQRKGPCPLHRGDGRGRSFSVNLDQNVFQCFDTTCGKKGDVIDLWATVN